MSDSVSDVVAAVGRAVTAQKVNGRTEFAIVATRTYAASADQLWDALTNASQLEQWFLPISGDLTVGGRYQFEGNAGGEIRKCEAPVHLAVTWEMRDDNSLLDLKLTALDAGHTELTMEHSGDVANEFWEQYGPCAVAIGWDMALFGVAEHLRADPTITRTNAESWMVSDEGKDFSRQSGAAWLEAAIAGGAAPDEATRAATTTIAFYTGFFDAVRHPLRFQLWIHLVMPSRT
jgi:uncharacterized protein YndB with AHSA1/START domain